jgi:ComF family protein
LEGVLDFLYPPFCLICGNPADGWRKLLCRNCVNKSARFEMPVCLDCRQMMENIKSCNNCNIERPLPLFTLGEYDPPLKDIIHKFKYDGYENLGVFLAERLLDVFEKPLLDLKIDLVVPVPLGSIRKKLRGFNQAEVLSDTIIRRLGLGSAANGVEKARKTKDQTRLNPAQRLLNIQNAFRLGDIDLQNKRIAIIDDVVTTGATVNEIRRVVEEGGGRVVGIIAAASSHE